MAEYIEREATKKEFNIHFGDVHDAVIANRLIDSIQAADVAPVVHGRWEAMHYDGGIFDGTNFDKCSVCGYERIIDDVKLKTAFNYCPNCGAKMDGGRKDNGC